MGKTVNVSGFPPEVNTMEVRQLFESITGSGTIHAIRLKKTKHGEKFYALVQFAQETHANKLLTQSTEVNTPYRLNFHEWKYEIDSKDKASMEHYIDGLLMHFGLLATPEKFKHLYSAGCSFGSGNQNLHFSAHLSEDYQIELPYENIGRISWHLSQEKDSKLLLIQLKRGPKIYEKQNQHVDPEYEKLNFCRGGFDNEWIRTTDFTSSSLIGQSSAIVFKFPRELKVDFKNIVINSSLLHYLTLELGFSYSSNTNSLAPVVDPPPEFDLPKGRSMMGCMDETNTLEYGQVFVRCSYSTNLSLTSESSPTQDPTLTLDSKPPTEPYNIIGDVVVAKSPCLHPGDVRVLKAIAVTDLNHMTDCIVFPQKGHRPHPNECSGSDLDGDLYFVSWDPELIPPNTYEPMDYTAEEPQALDHEVTIQEITKHFTNYPLNNNVGTISNLHKVFADKEGEKAGSKQCLELAKMASAAVDFPKTGVEVKIPPHLYVKEYPDFMENQNKLAYKSKTVIGKLFRELKKLGPPYILSTSSPPLSHDEDLVFDGFENHIELASDYKKSYDSKLRQLMDTFGIETEAEIVCRGMGMSEPFNESGKMIENAFQSLTKEALSWFNGDEEADELAKASAWYIVTNHKDYVSTDCLDCNQLWSFPWCVYDRLVKIKTETARNKKEEVCKETH